jgi:sirohydrochlorin cobaltochelatase
VTDAYARGVRRISVLPLFLTAGKHLRVDGPAIAERLRLTLPLLDLTILPPIGQDRRFAGFVRQVVEETAFASGRQVVEETAFASGAGRA